MFSSVKRPPEGACGYTWTFTGGGAATQSFTIQIGPVASVPEPASFALLGAGLFGLGRARRAG